MIVYAVIVKNILHRYVDTVWIDHKHAETRQKALQENLAMGGADNVYVLVRELTLEDGALAPEI